MKIFSWKLKIHKVILILCKSFPNPNNFWGEPNMSEQNSAWWYCLTDFHLRLWIFSLDSWDMLTTPDSEVKWRSIGSVVRPKTQPIRGQRYLFLIDKKEFIQEVFCWIFNTQESLGFHKSSHKTHGSTIVGEILSDNKESWSIFKLLSHQSSLYLVQVLYEI